MLNSRPQQLHPAPRSAPFVRKAAAPNITVTAKAATAGADGFQVNPIEYKLKEALTYCTELHGNTHAGPGGAGAAGGASVTQSKDGSLLIVTEDGAILRASYQPEASALVLAFDGFKNVADAALDTTLNNASKTAPFYLKAAPFNYGSKNWETGLAISNLIDKALQQLLQVLDRVKLEALIPDAQGTPKPTPTAAPPVSTDAPWLAFLGADPQHPGDTSKLEGVRRVVCTGYRAGGALAAAAAPWAALAFPKADVRCITYEAPRVGTEEFERVFYWLVSYAYNVANGGTDGAGPLAAVKQQVGRVTGSLLTVGIPLQWSFNTPRKERLPKVQEPLFGLSSVPNFLRNFIVKGADGFNIGSIAGSEQAVQSPTYAFENSTLTQAPGSVPVVPLISEEQVNAIKAGATQQPVQEVVLSAVFQAMKDTAGYEDGPSEFVGEPYELEDMPKNLSSNCYDTLDSYLLRGAGDGMTFKSRTGLEHAVLLDDKATDAQAYVAWCNGTAILAFRGTDSLDNFINDAKIAREPVKGLPQNIKGEVHSGFLEEMQALLDVAVAKPWDWKGIAKALEQLQQEQGDEPVPPTRVICTGHSLGGALATLGAAWASLQYPGADVRCFSFASPHVGNNEAAECFHQLVGMRCRTVYQADIVPRLLNLSKVAHFWDPYWHVDPKVHLRMQGQKGKMYMPWEINPWTSPFEAWWCGVRDHAMHNYVTTLQKVPPSLAKDTAAQGIEEPGAARAGAGAKKKGAPPPVGPAAGAAA
ncbi:hypothetical protein N2152v2_002264 [Parachlorella kessleri]